ncbi:hypothetical protein F3Y22_tig00117027pilonHSYRG00073 [Hibiscus syriacus]|uniref:Uncharacterized protein n=1 Tax=Hibiscus syriacus TaxID=106335 RepID=A0A6A2WCH6_HIBSY|nr:hypothetical protein F3Y22_tig00117027pilonHSYRG00073 [Hibiscus syriacus]
MQETLDKVYNAPSSSHLTSHINRSDPKYLCFECVRSLSRLQVAPICYAHLAASQLGQFMKFEDASETSSSHGGVTAPGAIAVPQLPRLKENVSSSMFFC